MNGWGRLASSIAALAALAGLGCATASFEAGCSPQAGSRTPAPLMWRADQRDSGGVLYLFGSIHFASESAPQFTAEIEAAYARSDELVVAVLARVGRIERATLLARVTIVARVTRGAGNGLVLPRRTVGSRIDSWRGNRARKERRARRRKSI